MESETFHTTNAFTSASFFHSSLEALPTSSSPSPSEDSHASPEPQRQAEEHDSCKPTIVPRTNTDQLLELLRAEDWEQRKSSIPGGSLHFLLLSVLEGVSTRGCSRSTTYINSTLHLVQSVTHMFEDIISLWLQSHNHSRSAKDPHAPKQAHAAATSGSQSPLGLSLDSGTPLLASLLGSSRPFYHGIVHMARITLRIWLVLASQVLHSSISAQQLADVKTLLFTPMATVSRACYNLQQAGVFKGNECLDHEFTLVILESLLACLHAINLLGMVVSCSAEDYYHALRDCLTDGCQEWFTYLCSKLHGVSESEGGRGRKGGPGSSWEAVMGQCHKLLIHILRELILSSSHIQAFQKSSKSALAREHPGSVRPAVYSLDVSIGFDKLTQRLSKLAQLLLDIFRTVPIIQLLSLQLLAETATDTVGIIGSFLKSISDASVWSNTETIDLYLDLLENVWFRLSPEYSGSPSWWRKLSNYSVLLQEASQEVVHQVLYHIQCLFSHESTTLKSELTRFVILPFQAHLVKRLRKKVCLSGGEGAAWGSPKSRRRATGGPVDPEKALEAKDKVIIPLFLKLLLKVVSNPASLSVYTSSDGGNGSSLYSLFFLVPLCEFHVPALGVIEETIDTLGHGLRGVSPTRGNREADARIHRTLLHILLKLAFMLHVDMIPDLCLKISEGKTAISSFGFQEADQVHQMIQNTFENLPLSELVTPTFARDLSVVGSVWEVLARLAQQDESFLSFLIENHVWDVSSILAPSLGSLLSRIQQRLAPSSGMRMAVQKGGGEGRGRGGGGGGGGGGGTKLADGWLSASDRCVARLREVAVSLLAQCLTLAHLVCWEKKDTKVHVIQTETLLPTLYQASFTHNSFSYSTIGVPPRYSV